MLRAGLTGGLGSGKTTVAGIFRSLGAHVIEADALGRELMSPGNAVYDEIIQHFGPRVVRADQSLDRRLLADLAFRQNRVAELNQIVHPPVIAAQQQQAEEIFAQDPGAVVVVESALIFEADQQGSAPGWRQRFDKIILVSAPQDLRISRYVDRMAQTRITQAGAPSRAELEAEAHRRIGAQIPDSEKIPLADYVIQNDGSLETTRLEATRVFAELARASRRQPQSL